MVWEDHDNVCHIATGCLHVFANGFMLTLMEIFVGAKNAVHPKATRPRDD